MPEERTLGAFKHVSDDGAIFQAWPMQAKTLMEAANAHGNIVGHSGGGFNRTVVSSDLGDVARKVLIRETVNGMHTDARGRTPCGGGAPRARGGRVV